MATPQDKLANALGALAPLQLNGRRVFRSAELSRTNRERLVAAGFLREVIKGWLVSSGPASNAGDSTPWHASFWEFCSRYCNERFGDAWHLSPEQSLLLLGENTVTPGQVIVYTPKGANNTVDLAFGSSIYDLQQATLPPPADLLNRDGLRLYAAPAALLKVRESFFQSHAVEARVVLGALDDVSDLLRRLLNGGHSVVAGRLAGAFRAIGRDDDANEIAAAMKSAGYAVRENNPFAKPDTFATQRATKPIVARLQIMWETLRARVVEAFPEAPGLPTDPSVYLSTIDDIYQSDAYHSLSIEGYTVTASLIERVRSGQWNPDEHEADRKNRDALAARGYWQAFLLVKATIEKAIVGANPGTLLRTAHRDWYRELFAPCVSANIIPAGALAGYRNDAVYLRSSRYVPPRWEVVREGMAALFDLVEQEQAPAVRAVLGHWLFGYIHPYPDGNGRLARFVMNVMLASGGYPWTILRVEDRKEYLACLDTASIGLEIGPFAELIATRVRTAMKATS